MTLFQAPAVFDDIKNPLQTINPQNYYPDLQNGGLIAFASNVIKTLIIGAGLFAFINLVIAGFQYVSSAGNTEATTQAWQKIYMSLIGLIVMVAAFAVAAILGIILFKNPAAILNPVIYGPGSNYSN